MRTRFIKTTLIAIFLLTFSFTTFARIGEDKGAIQGRLFTKSGGAYIYPSKEERFREAMELPYKYMFLLMPDDTKQCFFFKRADETTTTMSDTIQQHELYGWESHITLQNDSSVLEFYRRHGDPLTVEELTNLFELQKKENATWKKTDFIDTRKQWSIQTKDGKPSITASKSTNLKDVLPILPNRFIYIEIPEEVKKSTDFQQSLQSQIMEYEQRLTYAKYRNYLDKQSQIKEQKTKRKPKKTNTPAVNANARKIIPADSYTHRYIETEFSSQDNSKTMRIGYNIEDVFFADRPIKSPTKEVRLSMYIPTQPDTAFGYSYETSDGLVRAKIYRNAVLFFSAKFDKQLRQYMEDLYKQQSEKRVEEAKGSTSKF